MNYTSFPYKKYIDNHYCNVKISFYFFRKNILSFEKELDLCIDPTLSGTLYINDVTPIASPIVIAINNAISFFDNLFMLILPLHVGIIYPKKYCYQLLYNKRIALFCILY